MLADHLPVCLDEVIQYLNGLHTRAELASLSALLRSPSITADALASYAKFDPHTYKRNLLASSSMYELLLLCWKPGQSSPVHNHEGSVCCVRVLAGTVTERRFEVTGRHFRNEPKVQLIKTTTIPADTVVTAYDAEIHSMTNEAERENLMTLHVYSPPLCMRTFSS